MDWQCDALNAPSFGAWFLYDTFTPAGALNSTPDDMDGYGGLHFRGS